MRHAFYFSLLLLLITNRSVGAAEMAQFHYRASIEGELKGSQLYQLALPQEALAPAQSNLADIRLFDDTGQEVPYVLFDYAYAKVTPSDFVFTVTDAGDVLINDRKAWQVEVEAPKPDVQIEAIQLDVQNRDFRQAVEVEGSNDRITWQPVTLSVIFDFSSQIDLRRTDIALPKPTAFTYYHLRFLDSAPTAGASPELSLSYNGLSVTLNQNTPAKDLRIDQIRAKAIPENRNVKLLDERVFNNLTPVIDSQKNTTLTLEAGSPLAILSLNVANPYFYRQIDIYGSDTGEPGSYRQLGSGQIYRFNFGTVATERTIVEVTAPKHKFYQITVINKDNPPLAINSLSLQWTRQHIFFIPQHTGLHTLFVGNSQIAPPDYELKNFLNPNNWPSQPYQAVTLKAVTENGDFKTEVISKPSPKTLQEWLLISIVVLLAAGLGYWIFGLVGQIKDGK